MKKLGVLFIILLSAYSLHAQVTVGQTKAQAIRQINTLQGKLTVDNARYLEASAMKKAFDNGAVADKMIFYINKDNLIYSIAYVFKNKTDRNSVAKQLAPLPYNGEATVSAQENERYLQVLLNEEAGYAFILMDVPLTKSSSPADYAVLKKTIQNWEELENNGPPVKTYLGATLDEVKSLATEGGSRYQGDNQQGYILFKKEVNNTKASGLDLVFSPQGKVIQAVWFFDDREAWLLFLNRAGLGADLLIQSDPKLQQSLSEGKTIQYELDKNTLFRFWIDANGFGAAFGDKQALNN